MVQTRLVRAGEEPAADHEERADPTQARIFTLKEYGLIEGTNDSFKVSQRFMDMKDEPQTSAAFKRNALQAIRGSVIFTELLKERKTKLPPREAVVNRLEQQKRFNPGRAKEIAAVLEDSLRFAGCSTRAATSRLCPECWEREFGEVDARPLRSEHRGSAPRGSY